MNLHVDSDREGFLLTLQKRRLDPVCTFDLHFGDDRLVMPCTLSCLGEAVHEELSPEADHAYGHSHLIRQVVFVYTSSNWCNVSPLH